MKGFLHTIAAIASLLLMSANAQAQERAGATETEYGKIVVYLETAEWGQKSPYNKFCFTSNGSQAVTGCVPTAYAILMHYHKWPNCANEKKVYHSGTGESIMLGHNYEWNNMLPSYRNGYTEEQATAVATLMRDIGYSYQVAYGTGSTDSGAGGEGAGKLIEIFKYKSESPSTLSATMATSRDILANDKLWIQYIKESLDAGCPIPYSSTTTSGGRHIFILDGYTDKGYFHFNWGWGGQGNGWFKLDDMKPDAYSDYSKSHRAYFMLKPDIAEAVTYTVSVSVNDNNAGTATVNGKSNTTVGEGTAVNLSATPNEGYTFSAWTLNGQTVSTNRTYTTTVSADAEYIANFKEQEETGTIAGFTIKAESTIGGTATVNGKSEVVAKEGEQLSLLATAEEGYIFIEWRVGTEVVSTEQFFNTTAQCDRTYTAVFEELAGTVTVEVKGSGGYAYVGDGTDRKQTVAKGSTVFIKATPAEGSGKKFAYWSTGNTVASGKGVIFSNENPYRFVANADAVFFVNFVLEETDLNVTIEAAATAGGTATIYGEQKQTIALGSKLIFEAKADEGYRFTCWTIDGEAVSTEPIYTTIAREAMTATANFESLGNTGIKDVETVKENAIFGLSGRKVENIEKEGVYIINGKTILRR